MNNDLINLEGLTQIRSHYPSCRTCTLAYSFVGTTCGWVCDGKNNYSEITGKTLLWLVPKNKELCGVANEH